MSAADQLLHRFPAPRPPGRPFAVPEEYRRLFAQRRVPEVVLPVGRKALLVGRYDDVRTVLSGPFSADGRNPGFPTARPGAPSTSATLSFFRMDGAEHRRYRTKVTAHFTVARLAALEPVVRAAVDELLDGLAGQPRTADLVQRLALPLPSMVICQILGVPYADRQYFHRLIDVMARAPEMNPETYRAAVGELRSYIERLAGDKRADPGDDLLSDLVRAFDADPLLDPPQLAAMVLLLLVAGQETTTSMIALGALALSSTPEARSALEDPTAVPNVVEEVLRHLSIAQWMPRVATEDVLVGGAPVRAGTGVVVLPMIANHDPEVFPDPERLDPARANAHRHLACGFGPHQCLGLQLARLELRVVYEALFRRFPDLRPAVAVDRLPFRQNSAFFSVDSLPVEW
ncbi:cytochrome P450 [Saccharothrix coeruleofusca]|uniref:Cytochrome P450 n=1 Tax=Saccharothrix coeruleofusca TaxID=33919 RepID=A0A918ASW2_9PSEU|nr:cytochrome P450 [Saccharothrix coeruleofusca]GGP78971.1 cytochrome P450 [Saccharothrix coeruleofusca]